MKLYSLKPGLKNARKAVHITQQQLADRLDVNLKTVMNWEQGIVNPPFETVMRLAELLHCDVDYLTGRIACRTHDLQFIHDQTGLSEKAIEKLKRLKAENRWTSSSDLVSALIEHGNMEHLLYLVGQRISQTKKISELADQPPHVRAAANDLRVDFEGSPLIVGKRNFVDSLLQAAILESVKEIADEYLEQHDQTPKERAAAYEKYRDEITADLQKQFSAGEITIDDLNERMNRALAAYLDADQ